MGLLYDTLALSFYKHGAHSQLFCFIDECLENKTIEISTSWHYVYRKIWLLLHFVAFFHVASLLSTGVDNEKVGVDDEKALELENRIFFLYISA